LGKLGFASFHYNTMTRQYQTVAGVQPELAEGNWKPYKED
jgi:hypothetical protein